MSSMNLIYTNDGKSEKCSPSSDWSEIQIENIRNTSLGNILFLGVKDADRGAPTILMPKMIAPFGESQDNYDRTTIDLSVTDDEVRESLSSLTQMCRKLVSSSDIENADDIADKMLPILIESTTGDHAPRIRVRMNGGEIIKYVKCDDCDTIPRGAEIRSIVELRNIWVSRRGDGTYRCGVGLYLNSASVSTNVQKVEKKRDLTEFLFEDDE